MYKESLLPSSSYRELLFRCLEPITFELCGLNFVHSLSISSQQETSKTVRKNEIDQRLEMRFSWRFGGKKPAKTRLLERVNMLSRMPLNFCRGRMNERLLSSVLSFVCRLVVRLVRWLLHIPVLLPLERTVNPKPQRKEDIMATIFPNLTQRSLKRHFTAF